MLPFQQLYRLVAVSFLVVRVVHQIDAAHFVHPRPELSGSPYPLLRQFGSGLEHFPAWSPLLEDMQVPIVSLTLSPEAPADEAPAFLAGMECLVDQSRPVPRT